MSNLYKVGVKKIHCYVSYFLKTSFNLQNKILEFKH